MADLTPQDIADFIAVWTAWGISVDEINAWTMGTVNGGPNNDGMYPLTNRSGAVKMVPSPAKIASSVPSGQPFDWLFDCYETREMVRVTTSLRPLRAPRALNVTEVRGSVDIADMSQVETYGVSADVLVNGVSMLSAPLRIMPRQLSSKADGTPQPVIKTALIPDDALVTINVNSEGSGTRGLRIYLKGNYAS